MLTVARTQKTRALSSAAAELSDIGSGTIVGLGARMAVQDSTASPDRASSNETHRVEDAHSAGTTENGTGRFGIHKVSIHDNPKAMTREKLIKFGSALKLRGSVFTDLGQTAQYTNTNHNNSWSLEEHSQ